MTAGTTVGVYASVALTPENYETTMQLLGLMCLL